MQGSKVHSASPATGQTPPAAPSPNVVFRYGRFEVVATKAVDGSWSHAVQFDSDCDCRLTLTTLNGADAYALAAALCRNANGVSVDVLREAP